MSYIFPWVLVFAANCETIFSGRTFLLADIAERMPRKKFVSIIQNKNTKLGAVVWFEDRCFEKHYVVYSNNEQ
ncbi:hypothetical protein WKV44_00850 [Spirochaetia bacterium 38H-sp]|uniref:Uncharacterized protein n=1 Tax=Rarispira pelagica TaxID=3141764 RepID=A0ABU9U8V0_9SPIR